MAKLSPFTFFLATGLALLAVGGERKTTKPTLPSGGGKPPAGGGSGPKPPPPTSGGSKPVGPTIPDSAPCTYSVELRGGDLPEGEPTSFTVANGTKASAAEAEQAARAMALPQGPPGSSWVLVGTCQLSKPNDDGFDFVNFDQAVIRTFADDD